MKNIYVFLNKNSRSIFYALTTGLGLFFALDQLKEEGINRYLLIIGLTILLQAFEVFLDWRYATKILRQIDLPNVNIYNLWGHILNHIILPVFIIVSVAGFIYYNSDDLIRIVAIFIVISINMILFINIRSYYQDEFLVEQKTRYVYTAIKLVIFFFSMNFLLHLSRFCLFEIWVLTCLVCFLILILAFLMIYQRAQVSLATIIYVIVSAFVISLIFMVLSQIGIILIGLNVITFLLFYFALSILHHKMERTLTRNVLGEYILILILALSIFFGLS